MSKRVQRRAFSAVLLFGVFALISDASAGRNWTERWTCTSVGLASFRCLQENSDPDCTKVSLTGDMSSSEGTIQVTGMPMENTRFIANQFDCVWAWPLDDPEYVFGINHNRTGFYFSSLPLDNDSKPSATFHCRRESN